MIWYRQINSHQLEYGSNQTFRPTIGEMKYFFKRQGRFYG